MTSKTFEDDRNYVLGDPELSLIGSREKLAQWRHKGRGPAYYKLGRKIVYRVSVVRVFGTNGVLN